MAEHQPPDEPRRPTPDPSAGFDEVDELDEGWNPHPLPPPTPKDLARGSAESAQQIREKVKRALSEDQDPE